MKGYVEDFTMIIILVFRINYDYSACKCENQQPQDVSFEISFGLECQRGISFALGLNTLQFDRRAR